MPDVVFVSASIDSNRTRVIPLKEPIAISGVGLTTCLGVGVDANWEALRAGRSGLDEIERFETGDYPVSRGGEAPPASAGEAASFEEGHLLAAIQEACRNAGWDDGRLPEGAHGALSIGSSLAGSSTSAERIVQT